MPTYVILINNAGTVGVGGSAIATAATNEMMQLQFNVAGGSAWSKCPVGSAPSRASSGRS